MLNIDNFTMTGLSSRKPLFDQLNLELKEKLGDCLIAADRLKRGSEIGKGKVVIQ